MGWKWRYLLASRARRSLIRGELLGELTRPADAGLPWPETVAASSKEHPEGVVREALAQVAVRLQEGTSLSESLSGLEALVGHEARPVLAAAERSGDEAVSEALRELERATTRGELDAARLREGWFGPAITLAVAFGVLGLLGARSAPVLAEMAGDPEPLLLRLIPRLGLSTGVWVVTWLVGCVLAGVLAWTLGRLPFTSGWIDRIPVWGALRRSALALLLTRSLARLLGAGVGLDEALRSSAPILPSGSARTQALAAAARLSAGEPAVKVFSVPPPSFPPVLGAVLSAADGDDGLADGLQRLAAFEEADLDRAATRAAIRAALLALLVAGAVAGLVVVLGWGSYFETLRVGPT